MACAGCKGKIKDKLFGDTPCRPCQTFWFLAFLIPWVTGAVTIIGWVVG